MPGPQGKRLPQDAAARRRTTTPSRPSRTVGSPAVERPLAEPPAGSRSPTACARCSRLRRPPRSCRRCRPPSRTAPRAAAASRRLGPSASSCCSLRSRSPGCSSAARCATRAATRRGSADVPRAVRTDHGARARAGGSVRGERWGPLRAIAGRATRAARPRAPPRSRGRARRRARRHGGDGRAGRRGRRRRSARSPRCRRARASAAALRHGGAVYLVGGEGAGQAPSDEILRFDPAIAPRDDRRARFVEPLAGAGYVQAGELRCLLVGGWTGEQYATAVLRFTPPGTAAVVARLPEAIARPGRRAAAAARSTSPAAAPPPGSATPCTLVDLALGNGLGRSAACPQAGRRCDARDRRRASSTCSAARTQAGPRARGRPHRPGERQDRALPGRCRDPLAGAATVRAGRRDVSCSAARGRPRSSASSARRLSAAAEPAVTGRPGLGGV